MHVLNITLMCNGVVVFLHENTILGEPLRAKYYGGLEKTSISHDRKYCAVIG